METIGGAFFMAIKGQKYKHYPESLKREAVRLRTEEGWTLKAITTHLDIHDADRVKKWMRKYRREGERVFEDRRGDPFRTETEEYRHVKRLEMENEVLKKWLVILNQEVSKRSNKS
jgi:transposase